MSAPTLSPAAPATATFAPPTTAQYVMYADAIHPAPEAGRPTPGSVLVRMNAWESSICGWPSAGVNACMALCLPCISLAQISQRIGWAKYWPVMLGLVGLYLVEVLLSEFVLVSPYHNYWWDYRVYDYDSYQRKHTSPSPYSVWSTSSSSVYSGWSSTSSSSSSSWSHSSYSTGVEGVYVAFIIGVVGGTLLSFCTYLGSLAGLVFIFVTWALRSRVRTLFGIPGSCCGDCFASFCCSCCAVTQMATHIKTYKKGDCNFGPVDTLPAFLPQ